ncbi:MAG: long-chain-fatty-acid--CoA ligase [Deltaproteobacteria bacterium]|nr:long-chain-fatty-acid--CoA ligase [Deltaproteobacteria bacterium]
MNVGMMLERAANKFPRKTAVICGDDHFTYQAFNQRVNRLGQALMALGLDKGDRLGVLTENCYQFLELYFAAAKTGAIFCPYNNLLTERETRELINYSDPRYLFVSPAGLGKVDAIRDQLPGVQKFFCLGAPDREGFEAYDALVAGAPSDAEPGVEVLPDDVMSIYFTSGTTGLPKGAMRTHLHLCTTAITGCIENGIGYHERVLIVTPMYHVSFEDNIGRCFFVPNTTVIFPSHFDPGKVLEMLDRERITCALLVPTMINAMVHSPKMETVNLEKFRRIFYVGAPMPVELLKKSLTTFGRFGCGFCQQYGATETGPLSTILLPEDHLVEGPPEKVHRLASAGRPVLDYQIKILLEDREAQPGEAGEIVVKSEAMMQGYWRMPEETAAKVIDGWFHTGDIGYADEEGYIFIVDRKNDLIISGGKNIYPREVEEVLYAHPAVLEALVVGVPDDYWGEAVKAVVTLKSGQPADEKDIITFCGERLAGYKKPKTVEFWPELPKTASGKLLKRKVREGYWEGRDRKI